MSRAEIVVVDDVAWRFGLRRGERIDFFVKPDTGAAADTLDTAVVASVLYWMRRDAPKVRIRGPVSGALLANLEELQCCWAKWRPHEYRRFEIVPDQVVDDRPVGAGAIAAFSGGVDAAFTLLTRSRPSPDAALIVHEVAMVHGFDIALDEPEVFARALARAEAMAEAVNVPVRVVRTDMRSRIPVRWEDFHGLAVASALLTFHDRRETGSIGSTCPYDYLAFPHGSSPVQDWMAGTGRMRIRHDGSGFDRTEKVERIADVPAVVRNLRVCWSGVQHDRNCGRCEKCVRTMLNFRATGRPVPRCFPHGIDRHALRSVRPSRRELLEYEMIIAAALARQVRAPWIPAVRRMIRRRRLELRLRDTPLAPLYRAGRRLVGRDSRGVRV